ncbi:hypothetical protein JCM12141A_57680 [Mycolicibacterium hodleri]
MCAATSIMTALIPPVAALSVVGTVPMGLLAYRHRFRAFVAAAVAGSVMAFVVAGNGGASTVLSCAYIGGITGFVKRRGRGFATVMILALAAGVVAGIASVGALMVLSRLRELAFASMQANVDGVAAVMARVPVLHGLGDWIHRNFALALHLWPLFVGGSAIAGVLGMTVVGWWALSRVLRRLGEIPDVHKLDSGMDSGPVEPVPVHLRDVAYRYPGMGRNAVGPLTMSI